MKFQDDNCFVNFILAEHEFKFVFKLISVEIAFV